MGGRQLSLFEAENMAIAGIAGFTSYIRSAMNRAAAASPYSRQQIVDRMNALALAAGVRLTQGKAKTITLDTLEKWLNPASDHVPGLLAVEVFMRALGAVEPLAAWLALHGAEVMTGKDKMLRDLGEAKLRQKHTARKAARIEQQLEEEWK